MTIHKLTAGDGYTYLTEHIAGGDVDKKPVQDAAEYYTAEGNPAGVWVGRGLSLLGLQATPDGNAQRVREDQMRNLFGLGLHPEADRMMAAYQREHLLPGMSQAQQKRVAHEALRHAGLGQQFSAYTALAPFKDRVHDRLAVLIEETGRAPTAAEEKRIRAEEAGRHHGSVAGYDVVFAPVKSAALLWALDPRPWVRDAVMAAHHEAKDATMGMLEEHAAFTRTGTNGVAQIQTKGLIAVSFDHYDSRDGDPNPHTHVAISNKVQGVDGVWRALDGRAVYRITVAASEHYNSAFQIALTQKLGVRFTPKDMGRGVQPVYEIAGIDSALITGFSSRRQHLVARYEELTAAYRREHGRDPSASTAHKLARRANLDTREGKKPPRSLTAMRHAWTTQARDAHGADAVANVMAVVPDPAIVKAPTRVVEAVRVEDLAAMVVASVGEKKATWTVWNLRAEAERLLKTAAAERQPITDATGPPVLVDSLSAHRVIVAAVLAHAISPGVSISIEAPAMLDEPAALRRADGVSVFVQHAATRYTSNAVLDAEQRLLTAATTPAQSVDGVIVGPSLGWVSATLDGFEATTGTELDPGQRALVTAFTTDPRLLVVGIGAAGTGKTTAMRAYQHTLTQQNRRLIPLATSAKSAQILATELGAPAENVHKFLTEHTLGKGAYAENLSRGITAGLPASKHQFLVGAGDVILIDEAGMAGTPTLDRIVAIAAHHGATVRLLGDYRQLAAVESGGVLRLIATDVGAVELSTLHRFSNPTEAAATLQIRIGDTTGLTFYDTAQRISGGSSQAMTEAVYTGWAADMRAGKVSVMSAATNTDVTALSAQARADRVTAGHVEPGGITLHDGNTAGVGDWIVTRDNQRRLITHAGKDFVRNGDAWRVEVRHDDGSLGVRNLGHGGRVRLPAAYVGAQVELLYASTVHRTQGSTVDTAHALVSTGMLREHLYVALTRAQHSTHLYVSTHELLPVDEDRRMDAAAYDPLHKAALEVLHTILAAEGAQVSATQAVRDAQTDAESLATFLPRHGYIAEKANAARYRQTMAEIIGTSRAAELFRDPNWLSVSRVLADGEAKGWTAKHLLTAGTRDGTGGHSTAALTPPAPSGQPAEGTPDTPASVLAERLKTLLSDRFAPAPLALPGPADTDRFAAQITSLTDTDPAGLTHQAAAARPADGGAPVHDFAQRQRLTATAYGGILGQVLGSKLAQKTIREGGWPAVQIALARLDLGGHDPQQALKQVTNRRELTSAGSISAVLAWRLADHHLTHPQPAPTPRLGSTSMLSDATGGTSDPTTQASGGEPDWPLLAWMLKAQENAGRDITRILPTPPTPGTPEATRTPPTVADLVTHVRRYAATADRLAGHTSDLPPWLPTAPTADTSSADLAEAIQTRVRELADTTARTRPAWAQSLGQAPTDPLDRATWLRQVGVVAAYREQYQVTDNDPDRPLGPYREKADPGHRAYWHAAHATLTAHHLTHPPVSTRPEHTPGQNEPTGPAITGGPGADRQSTPQDISAVIRDRVTTDIYRGLPVAERALIGGEVAVKLGHLWFGPDTPTSSQSDTDTALIQPVYALQLHAVLTERGHLNLPDVAGETAHQRAGTTHRVWRPSNPMPDTDRRLQRANRRTHQPQETPTPTPAAPVRTPAPLQQPPAHHRQPGHGPRLMP